MNRIVIILLLFLILRSESLFTQIVSTPILDTLILQTLERNPQLQAERSKIASAKARITTARAWPDPLLTFEYQREKLPLDHTSRLQGERRISLQQMIPFPGKTTRAATVEEAEVLTQSHMTSEMERLMIAEVKKQYGMLYAAQRKLEVVKENQEWLRQMIVSAETRLAVGLSQQADVLRLQTELSKLKSERTMIESDIRVTEGMINKMRAMPPTTTIPHLPDYSLDEFAIDVDNLTSIAGEKRPELRAMKSEVEMLKAEVNMWKGERFPDFMLGAGYMWMRDMESTWEAMISINIPIAPWSSGKYSGRIEENEALQRAAEQRYEESRNRIAFEVYEAWSKAHARWESARRYEKEILPQAEQALESLFAEYQTRRTDFLSVLDAFRMLAMHRMNYFMEVGEYIQNLADIEHRAGISFDELKNLK